MKVYKVTLNEMDGYHTYHSSYKKAINAMAAEAASNDKEIENIDVQIYCTYYTFTNTTFGGVIETIFVN